MNFFFVSGGVLQRVNYLVFVGVCHYYICMCKFVDRY